MCGRSLEAPVSWRVLFVEDLGECFPCRGTPMRRQRRTNNLSGCRGPQIEGLEMNSIRLSWRDAVRGRQPSLAEDSCDVGGYLRK
jgi:hypothetical protein